MRILWITENYYPNKGGMAQSCDRIVSGLRERAVDIDLIHLVKQQRRSITHYAHGIDRNWPLGTDPNHGLRCCWNWIEKQKKYDIVVAFGCHYALTGAQTYAAWLGAKLITLVRGNDFDTGIFDIKKRSFLQEIYQKSHCVISVSHDKSKLIKCLFPTVNTHTIANGINLSQWEILPSHRKQLENIKKTLPQNKTVIGLIGHLKEKKGISLLLDAIKKSGLQDHFHLLLIGEIQPVLMEKLQEGISHTCHPFIDRHQLIPYYLACHFIAIPSYYDGMPNVLLEAGVLGVPVIASDTGGMTDMITHEKNGLLFTAGEETELRQLIHTIHQGDQLTHKHIGESLKSTITSRFTHDIECQAYLACFENLIHTQRALA